VDPQYLTLEREFEPAKAAKNILDTDYMIDNGLIQVREDGGYIARHNPMFLAKLNWSYFPYPFMNFKNDESTVSISQGNDVKTFEFSQLQVTDMHLETAPDKSWAAIYVSKGNSLFSYTQILTVYKNTQFVNMTVTLQTKAADAAFSGAVFTLQAKGQSLDYGNTVGFYDDGGKVLAQLIFVEEQPTFHQSGPDLIYNFTKNSKVQVELWATVYSVSDRLLTLEDPATQAALGTLIANNLESYQQPKADAGDLSLDVFDYRQAIADWNVSYVAVRNSEIMPKFVSDPAFSLPFINDEVAIFLVK
jgi:hypothetical protein